MSFLYLIELFLTMLVLSETKEGILTEIKLTMLNLLDSNRL